MSHEVISSFIAIGIFVLISFVVVGVIGGVSAIVEAFRERNELRVKAYARREIYSRQGKEITSLLNKIKTLEWALDNAQADRDELAHRHEAEICRYEAEIRRRDVMIDNLNKTIEAKKRKAPAAATTEASAEGNAESKRPSNSTTNRAGGQ